ncbi:MAG TPA: hypothetical protein VFT29_09125 [Gemmatimonadaceae bacterium]|nr:hypothetical protein [Gemmatimonadaceae bacterium]
MIAAAFLLQLAASSPQPPVLAFPEPGLDDAAAYQGYKTRFYRDAAGNTVQIYIEGASGRVVHLWADADDESLGFTLRDASGAPAPIEWDGNARISTSGRWRAVSHALVSASPRVTVGWFQLGSMRIERDLQYSGQHRSPFSGAPYRVAEFERMLTALEQVQPIERRRQLALLNAADLPTLRARLRPKVSLSRGAQTWVLRVLQPSLDAKDTLALSLSIDRATADARLDGDSLTLTSRNGGLSLAVEIATTGRPLGRLSRQEIFNKQFLAFLAGVDPTSTRGRWLEREVRGVELLSSREKLMAGLPAYATYFGRDMLVSALMMRPIWRGEMSEFAIASVLRKVSPRGDVSHEEALGGQADREAASEYASLIGAYLQARTRGDSASARADLTRARSVLRDHRRVRENYHMIDDEFQFPVLVADWLRDSSLSAAHKRAFLVDSSDGRAAGGGTRLERLVRELSLVADMTAAYVANPMAENLVSFAPRDSGRWSSASWRDSGAGYAGGRFAMDVNAIWAPRALDAIGEILRSVASLGFSLDSLARRLPALAPTKALGRYVRDPSTLHRASDAWWAASRHFVVTLSPQEVRTRVQARLAALPDAERSYWEALLTRTNAAADTLEFLALSLDAQGRTIGVASSDPATRLFLGDRRASSADSAKADALRDVRLFVRAYPVGLFIEGVGPVVANDAYAAPTVWAEFERDRYHGPRVVWGREVNLFLLGVANHVAGATQGTGAYVDELRAAAQRVRGAVDASGFHSELWSYEIAGGRVRPVRYGTGSDVQLWSTTDLAVQYAWQRLTGTSP